MGANGFFQANRLLVAHTKKRFFEPNISFGEMDHQRVQNMVGTSSKGVLPRRRYQLFVPSLDTCMAT